LTNKSLKTLVGLSANQLRPVGSKTASGLQLIILLFCHIFSCGQQICCCHSESLYASVDIL